MKKLLWSVSLLIFIILNVCCAKFFRFVVNDDTIAQSRYMMHDLYSEEDNIDVLFLGTSHSFCSLDPEITDAIFKMNTFNAGSQSQDFDGSLTLLKEVCKHHDVKKVYLEMFFEHSIAEEYTNRTELERVWVLSDYMKPSINKYDFLIHGVPKEYYVCTAIVARRNWYGLLEPGKILSLVRTKMSDDYMHYVFHDPEGIRYYHKKGYHYSDVVAPRTTVIDSKEPINNDNITNSWRIYLHKIMDYCEKNDIELTLYSAPVQDYQLNALGNYDEYIKIINREIENTGVKYYDFNLCREEFFPNRTDWYRDRGHLNRAGGEVFSRLFSDFFTGRIDEKELFYDSYSEKMRSGAPEVYCLMRNSTKDETMHEEGFTVISSDRDDIQCRVYWEDENERVMVKDYDHDQNVILPIGKPGKCTIDFKTGDFAGTWTADFPEGL